MARARMKKAGQGFPLTNLQGKTEECGTHYGVRTNDSSTSNFLINEFDDKWKARDLYNAYKDLWNIDEVIILEKRDRRGRRYTFVQIFNVKDERLMATKLDNVFLEGRKLFANLSRFQRKQVFKRRGGVGGRGRNEFIKNGGGRFESLKCKKQTEFYNRGGQSFERNNGKSFMQMLPKILSGTLSASNLEFRVQFTWSFKLKMLSYPDFRKLTLEWWKTRG